MQAHRTMHFYAVANTGRVLVGQRTTACPYTAAQHIGHGIGLYPGLTGNPAAYAALQALVAAAYSNPGALASYGPAHGIGVVVVPYGTAAPVLPPPGWPPTGRG